MIKKEKAENQNEVKVNVKISMYDREDTSLNSKIKKPLSQITLTDIKSIIGQRWRLFKKFQPNLQNYTYSAKTIDEDGRDDWLEIQNDFDIIPSFDKRAKGQLLTEKHIEIRCVS